METRNGRPRISHHRKSLAILALFAFLLIAELAVVHVILSLWSVTVAWVVSVLSAYVTFQFLAHMKAVYLRPTTVIEDRLFVRCGLLGDAEILLEQIEKVSVLTGEMTASESVLLVSPVGGMITPNVRLTLKSEVSVYGFYGLARMSNDIVILLDHPEEFVEFLRDISRN